MQFSRLGRTLRKSEVKASKRTARGEEAGRLVPFEGAMRNEPCPKRRNLRSFENSRSSRRMGRPTISTIRCRMGSQLTRFDSFENNSLGVFTRINRRRTPTVSRTLTATDRAARSRTCFFSYRSKSTVPDALYRGMVGIFAPKHQCSGKRAAARDGRRETGDGHGRTLTFFPRSARIFSCSLKVYDLDKLAAFLT